MPFWKTSYYDFYNNYDGENVTFSYNDHKDESYHEITMKATEFIMLLLRHLLPKQYKIIRYYGFYNIYFKIIIMIIFMFAL